jgi:TPR repeat protein
MHYLKMFLLLFFISLNCMLAICAEEKNLDTYALALKQNKTGNYVEAAKYFEQSSNEKNGKAYFYLAEYYCNGRKGVKVVEAKGYNYCRRAIELLTADAEKGDAEALYMLGACQALLDQRKEAYASYMKAAQQNNPDALCAVALCLIRGAGVKADQAQALNWLNKAVAAGSLQAKAYLASYYFATKKNIAEGAKLAKETAEAGNAAGQYTLGMAYERGAGVAQDNKKAIELYRQAADQGFKDAKLRLSWLDKNYDPAK